MSLLEIIPSYFEFLLNFICAHTVGHLCRDLGMETIMRIENSDNIREKKVFTQLLLYGIKSLHFSIPEDEMNLGNVLNVKYPNVGHSQYHCYNIPLYGLLNSRINDLKEKTLLNMKPQDKDPENVTN